MSIAILNLLVDFGLFILIWMIQLIVYPSFLYYERENLITWHKKYVPLIGYIVAPLMFLQLGISIYQIINVINFYTLINLLIICVIWIATFGQFVPIHNSISKGVIDEEMLFLLVRKNWIRTVLWTILFLISLVYYVF